jgi:hypothetical protein
LEGRVKIGDDLLLALSGSDDLQIDAPNEMGEPWSVGRAEPMRALIQSCQRPAP